VEDEQLAGVGAVEQRYRARTTPTDDRVVATIGKNRVRWQGDELIREVLAR
jgi:hypothetical protein